MKLSHFGLSIFQAQEIISQMDISNIEKENLLKIVSSQLIFTQKKAFGSNQEPKDLQV